MSLEEDRITNLLYLINQIKSITISDNTAIEKRRAIIQMANRGLLKHLGNNEYCLDQLGQAIVDSKKSYTQYLASQNTSETNDPSINKSNERDKSNVLKKMLRFFFNSAGVLVVIVGVLIKTSS